MNCLVSFMTGTSFGTAATMGVISMTIAGTAGANPVISGGAVISGCFLVTDVHRFQAVQFSWPP